MPLLAKWKYFWEQHVYTRKRLNTKYRQWHAVHDIIEPTWASVRSGISGGPVHGHMWPSYACWQCRLAQSAHRQNVAQTSRQICGPRSPGCRVYTRDISCRPHTTQTHQSYTRQSQILQTVTLYLYNMLLRPRPILSIPVGCYAYEYSK